MLIIAITGMPGAGKSTAARVLEEHGLRRIAMGDVVREETKRRGLPADEANTGAVMRDLREKLGPGAIAEVCLRSLESAKEEMVVIDGIRSLHEIDVFGRAGQVMLLAVHASKKRRFVLLKERGRSDDPASMESFKRRDDRELSIGIGNAIALADESISNEHISPGELGRMTLDLVSEWLASHGKRLPR